MKRRSVYISKLDPKLKKHKRGIKSKKKCVPGWVVNGLEYEFVLPHKDYPHFCSSCDLP